MSIIRFLVLGSLVAAAAPARAEDFFFKDGDAVVMIGDSITEQHLYSTYVEMWTVCRFPTWKLTFRNVGIGGDRSPGGNGRFERDVLANHPTALTVDFGMNDGNYTAFKDDTFQTYMKGLQGIADQARAAKIRVAWIAPSPIEKNEDGPPLQGYNETLERYSAGVGEIAKKEGALFVDQFHPFLKVEDEARAANPKNRIGGGDAVHPGPPGQVLMASAILKGMHFPTLVSAVEVDGAGKLVAAENCKVSDLTVKDGVVRFKRQDGALPFFPVDAKNILKWAPIRDELNDYRLKVTGLKEGQYEVRLGGQTVAQFSAAELAKGVNLAEAALTTGPVAEQVNKVWQAVVAKNQFHHDRIFRGIVLANVPDFIDPKLADERRQAALTERRAKLPELDEAIRKALVIEPHQVEIVPVAK
jgi:lysophospholipase L1-like esterase